MSIYYQDDFITLYHGDCLEQTAWLEADVLVTDPPYGQAYKSGMDKGSRTNWHEVIAGDESTDARDYALALWDSNKAGLVFGTWKVEKPKQTRQTIIWDKTPCGFMGDLAIPFGLAHEEIYCIGKDGWTGNREASIIKVQMLMSNDKNRPDHPTPKPVGLMERLIEKTTGLIADPFAGSGATLVAAKNLGRKAIGVELEEKYCELIAKRLSQNTFDFSKLEAKTKETYIIESLI
jgi:site-specific DNA-methyltransferase (adenine-specific)